MSIDYVNLRFLVRGGTAANLETVNEVPLARELIVATDTGRLKLGDGATAYNDLPYIGSSGGGAAWRNGSTVPADALGNDGDYYLRTTTGDVYAKVDGSYVLVANLRGPPGPAASSYPTAEFLNTAPSVPAETGVECHIPIPFGFEIESYTIFCTPAASLKVDVRWSSFADWPSGPGDSICGGNEPEIVSGDRAEVSSLTGWNTTIAAGGVMTFVLMENDNANYINFMLRGTR